MFGVAKTARGIELMDPISHILVGAAVARSFRAPRLHCWILAGLAELPDIDIFFGPWGLQNPTFFHRSFTHSFVIAGVMGLVVWKISQRYDAWASRWALLVYLLAVWSHVLTDLMTSYGTPVLWPFYTSNFALDWLSNLSLGPLLILGAGLVLSRYSRWGIRWAMPFTWVIFSVFLCFSAVLRGEAAGLIKSGEPVHALPDLINPLKWRLIVENERSKEYRLYTGWPLSGDVRALGIYSMPPDSEWIKKSLEDPHVRLFLKHNRWPLARVVPRKDGTSVEWGNLLFFWRGQVRGKLVVDMNSQAQVLGTRRVFEVWSGNSGASE